jgi:hypothetical protein
MNFNSFIKPFMKDSIATILAESRDCYGDVSKTAVDQGDIEYSLKCRFVDKPRYLWSPSGVNEIAVAQAWVDTSASIEKGNFVRYRGKEYEIYSVETKRGIDGRALYKKVLLR